MLAYREGARVVAGAHLGIAVVLMKLIDFSIRVLDNAGFRGGKPATITGTVINFTFGSVIEEQASPPLHEVPDESFDASGLLGQFPTMAKVMSVWMDEDNDTHFDTSVRIIINGVRAELNASRPEMD